MVKPANVTFDEIMRRDPINISEADMKRLTEVDRADRAAYAASKRKDKDIND